MLRNIKHILGYKCVSCKKLHPAEPFRYTCTDCDQNLDVVYDYNAISKFWSKAKITGNADLSIWRYLPLLPVLQAPVNHTIQIGGTPLIAIRKGFTETGIAELWIKDDSRNPSGSLKDRASEVGLQHAQELGADTLVVASTGNAAASLSALAAFHKKRAVVIAPASAPKAKLTQILQYGAELFPIDGSYDEAFDLSLAVAEQFGWYSRSTGMNPVLSEGKKTVALEIAEQLEWNSPDKIFVPVGDGCIIGGVYKGFFDLLQLGWVARLPQIIAVQSEGSAAIVNALESGRQILPVKANTIADSIAVDLPRDGEKALRAVRESGGFGIKVSDDDILNAQKKLSTATGIFAEPAAAAAFAGFLKSAKEGRLTRNEKIVILITGTGLKDIPSAVKKITLPDPIAPELSAFEKRLENYP